MYKGFLVVVTLSWAVAASAADTSVKLFAGTFESTRALQSNLKSGNLTMTRAMESAVPCNVGTRFGLVYVLRIPKKMQRRTDSYTFTENWHHPAIEMDGKVSTSRAITARFDKQHSSPKFAGWQLTSEGIADGDLTLTVSKDNEEYLRHKFMVRGCTEETRDELEDLLQAASSENDEIICREQKELGSNIPQVVCKTKAQVELETHTAREQLNAPP